MQYPSYSSLGTDKMFEIPFWFSQIYKVQKRPLFFGSVVCAVYLPCSSVLESLTFIYICGLTSGYSWISFPGKLSVYSMNTSLCIIIFP